MTKDPRLEPELTRAYQLIESIVSGCPNKNAEVAVFLIKVADEELRTKVLVGALGHMAVTLEALTTEVFTTMKRLNGVIDAASR